MRKQPLAEIFGFSYDDDLNAHKDIEEINYVHIIIKFPLARKIKRVIH